MTWAPAYVTTAELKAFVRISDTVDDAFLALAVEAASRAVDRHTNRQFGQVAAPEERHYTAHWDRRRCRWVVLIDDLMSVSGFAASTDSGSITVTLGVDLKPINAPATGWPWTTLVVDPASPILPTAAEDGVAITAVWGWDAVPDTVKQATLLQASRLFSRRSSPYGVAGSPDLGSELRLLARLDVDVSVALGPYIRWWGAA